MKLVTYFSIALLSVQLIALGENSFEPKNPRNILDKLVKTASVADVSLKPAEVPRYDQSHQLSMGPSSVVHNCVNAITGSVFDSEVDIEIPGTDLKIERFFVGLSLGQEPTSQGNHLAEPYNLFQFWTWNHSTLLTWRPHWNVLSFADHQNGIKMIHANTEARFDSKRQGRVHPTLFKGWTNTAQGYIGARFDMHNQTTVFDRTAEGWSWKLTSEDGTERMFDSLAQSWGKKEAEFCLSAESYRRHPSGLKTGYEHKDKFCLNRILAKSSDGQEMASVCCNSQGQFVSSDGQIAIFRFVDFKDINGRGAKGLLSHVQRSYKPAVSYEYTQFDTQQVIWLRDDVHIFCNYLTPVIAKKCFPDSRYLAFDYDVEFPRAWFHKRNVKQNKPSEHAGKVKAIRAPAGPKGADAVLYRFEYEKEKTSVFDQLGGLKIYHFDSEHRLKSVETTNERKQGGAKLCFAWGASTHEGRLEKQWLVNQKNQGVYLKEFEYDSRGNVTLERLHANITGKGSELEVDASGKILKGTETIEERNEYSDDAFHMPIRSIDHEGRETICQYVPGTNLPQAKWVKLKGTIVSREFFSYDAFAQPTLIIKDDGSSEDPSSLENVHVRLIQRQKTYQEPHLAGLVKESSEFYWDFQKNEEVLLTRTRYDYTHRRLLSLEEKWVAGMDQLLVHEYEYDEHRNIHREIREDGIVIERRFDANDNMIYEIGPDRSFETHLSYDQMNRVVQRLEKHQGLDLCWKYEYDLHDKLILEVDPWNRSTKYDYDSSARLTRTTKTLHVDEEGNKGTYQAYETREYDDFDRLILRKDFNGFVEKYAYNALGKPTYKQLPGEAASSTRYNLQGLKVFTELSTGAKERYEYDGLHRLKKLERLNRFDQVVYWVEHEYEGSLLKETLDSEGKWERLAYDGAGRVVSKEIGKLDSLSYSKEEYEYDGLHRKILTRRYANDQDYLETHLSFDVLGHLKREWTQTSFATVIKDQQYAYDPLGRITQKQVLEKGSWVVTKTRYDSLGNIVASEDALGNVTKTHYEYFFKDPASSVLLMRSYTQKPDGSQSEHLLTSDRLCLSSKVWSCDNELLLDVFYGYEASGHCTYRSEALIQEGLFLGKNVITQVKFAPGYKVIERREAKGSDQERITKWQYDDCGRLCSVFLYDGSSIDYEYNELGMLCHIVSSDETIDRKLTHNAYGQLICVQEKDQPPTQREYDIHGNVVKDCLSTGFSIEKTYDGLARVRQLTLPLNYEVTRGYEKCYLRSIDFKQGQEVFSHSFNEYDSSGRVVKESNAFMQWDRFYDVLGRQVKIQTPVFTASIPDDGFNCMGKLVKVAESFNDHCRRREFRYNALGELLEESAFSETDDLLNYTDQYVCNSRQQRVRKNSEHQFCDDLGQLYALENRSENIEKNYVYDARGRMVHSKEGESERDFAYDAFDRLIQMREGSRVWTYTYDGFDRRVARSFREADKAEPTLFYIYDDLFEIGSIEDNAWKDFRLIGLRQRSETGDSLLFVISGEKYIPIHDLYGSVAALYNVENGSLEDKAFYDVYGNEKAHLAKTATSPWGYAGKRTDIETGWIFFGKRYYIPSHGRWLTKDPKGEIDGSNLYAYLQNNPVYEWDLWGYSKIGVRPAQVKDLTGHQPEIKAFLEESFRWFETEYPEQKHNSCFVGLLVDPNAEFLSFSNGINTSLSEFTHILETMCKESGKNVIGVYNASEGFFNDFSHILKRELEPNGYQKIQPNPEYEMTAHMFRVGMQLNQERGFSGLLHQAHSNGEFVSAMASAKLRPDELLNLRIESYGGVCPSKLIREDLKITGFTSKYDIARNLNNFQGARPHGKIIRDVKFERWSFERGLRHHNLMGPVYKSMLIENSHKGYGR